MNIAIVGAGTRGCGIAQVSAIAGHNVALYDLNGSLLQQAKLRIIQNLDTQVGAGLLGRPDADRAKNAINTTTVLEQFADADVLIEAVSEKLDLKQSIIAKLDRITPRTGLIATASQTFSATQVASAAQRFPERVIGLHFFAPIPTHRLVSLVVAAQSSKDMVERGLFFLRSLDKQAVMVQDAPGHLTERLRTAYLAEAVQLVGEGQADAETVDALMISLGLSEGPLRQIDRLGLDTQAAQAEQLRAQLAPERFPTHYLLRKLISAGRLGRKTKQGFYKYDA